MAVGIARGGLPGAFAAWLGFTLPSAVAMIAFAYGIAWLGDVGEAGWLHGLKLAAVAVVAQALWGMARSLCPDRPRASIGAVAAIILLVAPASGVQLAVIAAAALVGWAVLKVETEADAGALHVPLSRTTAIVALALFGLLLAGLPLLAASPEAPVLLAVSDAFYRAGSLVFGGGHVVLPLLRAEMVPTGWVGDSAFLAGYGAAQAVPGPLFTFAAFLGTVASPPGAPGAGGWVGGLVALVSIFVPAFLLVVGTLPFWASLRRRPGARAALGGVNAAVVGLLGAAFWDPVLVGAVTGAVPAAVAVAGFTLLQVWKVPAWAVVIAAAGAGALLL